MGPDTDWADVACRDVSATERVRACLSRIEALNDRFHAVSAVLADRALEHARALDRAVDAGQPRLPLHGLPVLVKELADIEGLPTAFGSLAYATGPASATAPALRRLEEAGAVIVGTTHMVEFAFGSWGTNLARGTPLNPADAATRRVPGGSSSGSAVAVAAGLAPVAIGSDTGGSIRIPASLCGVVGFKPTYGLIPTEGIAPLGPTFDTLGPITRSVSDARLLTEVMAGTDLSHPAIGLAGLRIGVADGAALAPISDEVAEAYGAALARLRAAGARIEEIPLPFPLVEFQSLNGAIVAYEAYPHLAHLANDPSTPLDPNVRRRVQSARTLDPVQYQDRLRQLHAARATFAVTFSGLDLLVLPGTPQCATPLSDVDESEIPMSRYTRIVNCLALCSISLPLTRPAGGLPVGLQLCARANADSRLLAIASEMSGVL